MTVVGHSLGGGIAMQFAYQFPERCERLVLVSSGGLGREVHLLLRAAALPGADWVLPVLTSRGIRGRPLGAVLRRGPPPRGRPRGARRGFASLQTGGSRQAFLHTVRSVIDTGGQRVSANDRLHLAAVLPTLIVWGEKDSIIPPATARPRTRRCRGAAWRSSPAPGTCRTTTTRSASPRSWPTSARRPNRPT